MTQGHRDPELVEHLAFARRIASQLVGSSDRDDVVQDAYVAALQNPPRESGASRAFLGSIVRRVAGRSHRTRLRRDRRERTVVGREPPQSTDELAEAMEMHRIVVDEVMRLKPRFREVVLLRYVEDLETREIAERLHEPVETVRTRLKRAVAELRSQLQQRDGKWRSMLAPLIIARPTPPPTFWLGVPGLLVLAAIVTITVGIAVYAPEIRRMYAQDAVTPTIETPGVWISVQEYERELTLDIPMVIELSQPGSPATEHRLTGLGPHWVPTTYSGEVTITVATLSGFSEVPATSVSIPPDGEGRAVLVLRRK